MFGRTVKIDGHEVFVPCTPSTPFWEICLHAAKIFKMRDEAALKTADRKQGE